MSDHELAGPPVAAHDVEHARRQVLRGELGQHQGRHRRGLGGLQDHRVPGRDGRRPLPGRHHEGVVPRRDLGDDADGLAAQHTGVALDVLPRGRALRSPGLAGSGPDDVQDVRHLRPHRPTWLAGVAALRIDELLGPVLQGLREAKQGEHPLRRRGVPPAREGAYRGGKSRIEVGLPGDRCDLVGLTGRGVDDRVGQLGERRSSRSAVEVVQHPPDSRREVQRDGPGAPACRSCRLRYEAARQRTRRPWVPRSPPSPP